MPAVQIAKYAEKYKKQLQKWFELLVTEKPVEATTERYCINLASKEISLVHANITATTKELISYDSLAYEDTSHLPLILAGFLKKHTFAAIPTYWLLSPDLYQIFLIESLPVAAEEFQEALNWRVRSLINYPIENAIVDHFMLPPKKGSIDSMLSAVVAERSSLTNVIDTLKKSNLNLTVIDITELAMRNLTELYEDDEKSTAFVYFYNGVVLLNITLQKNLYFSRRFIFSSAENSEKDYEQLSLSLLRYFDYFQSQWRHPSPHRVFVASNSQNTEDLAKKLSKYLLITVQPFKIKSITGDAKQLSALEERNLLTLGCALRKGKNNGTRS